VAVAASSAHDRPSSGSLMALALALGVEFLCVGCNHAETLVAADILNGAVCPFNIYWPPRDPEENPPASAKPLLRGSLALNAKQTPLGAAEVRLEVTISRPSEEKDRQFWNSELAFADIAWMDEVRVWDADEKWLWPNLPYLLRLPGQERIERYGGTDPGKHVDNDFAAVLIRKYDAHGKAEAFETKDAPLVAVHSGIGKISWNFEKFVIGRDGEVVARFSPRTKPDDPAVVKVIEAELAKQV